MKLLDLFCGAGGAAMGYSRAGFDEIVGIDIEPQPEYPFTFMQGDALELARGLDLGSFDLIHASPPCQAFSTATPAVHDHPDLIDPVRELVQEYRHVIENVRGAGLIADLMLCGSMFGLQVQRHRYFEHNLGLIMAPPCNHKAWRDNGRPYTVTGNGGGGRATKHSQKPGPISQWQELMEMPWVSKRHGIAEAIPPAYTRFIGLAARS